MDPFADIDLDAEAIWLDGAWHTRDDLALRIKRMVEAGDFKVARPSEALERLEEALRGSRVLAVRMPNDLADALSAAAGKLGRPVGHLLREATAYYLAAAAAAAGRPTPAQEPSVDVDVSEDRSAEEAFFGKKLGG